MLNDNESKAYMSSQYRGPADSPLLLAVRDVIAEFVRQKGATSIAVVLAQVPKVMEPMVLEAVDGLAHDGVISVHGGAGGVLVAWHGTQEVTA